MLIMVPVSVIFSLPIECKELPELGCGRGTGHGSNRSTSILMKVRSGRLWFVCMYVFVCLSDEKEIIIETRKESNECMCACMHVYMYVCILCSGSGLWMDGGLPWA